MTSNGVITLILGNKEVGLESELILHAGFVFGTVSISADFHTAELGSDFP